uniref:Uncharacterized protein n=1 Tax=Romanomermis culicivorax TaxID=13658 RepID=A0A915KIQ6_ROMCU
MTTDHSNDHWSLAPSIDQKYWEFNKSRCHLSAVEHSVAQVSLKAWTKLIKTFDESFKYNKGGKVSAQTACN